jgi:GNAT superfamily N-acetyltransferase
MCIELASVADIPALADLLAILFTQEVEFQPDRAVQIRGLSQIIENPQIGVILVTRLRGTNQQDYIAGMANLLYTVSTALGARVALLEDVVVLPAIRGSGVGTQLLQAAIAHARLAGCQRITLLADQANEAAQHFYAKQGFSASSMVPLRLQL